MSSATTVGSDPSAPDSSGPGPAFDLGPPPDAPGVDTGAPPSCVVVDDMDAVGTCSQSAPANSFESEVQWAWAGGENGFTNSMVTPLVANLTDDDGNDSIDLCDIPDVVVVTYAVLADFMGSGGRIYVLDGATGVPHFHIGTPVDPLVTPALGDIDGDGLPEIVTATETGTIVAFEHDGTLEWQSAVPRPDFAGSAITLADLDADGDVEILAGGSVYDHEGALVTDVGYVPFAATAAADLDDDGDLEIVLGHAAYHHDGGLLWDSGIAPGFPEIANFDADPEPEILLTNQDGLAMLEHDGAVVYQGLRPTGDPGGGVGSTVWLRPAAVHDFDGDGDPEFAVSSASTYAIYDADGTIVWSSPVSDSSGSAGSTAFDFLGDGKAQAMYADENNLFIYDDEGLVLLQSPRTSATMIEYPVVADVDNDGSAEIVVVSNATVDGGVASPTVQVLRDAKDRWIPARRIWNQHAYHVTNVREDGTIPQHARKSWEQLNTFRTNAQIESGGVCIPAG